MYSGGKLAPWFSTKPVESGIRNIIRLGLAHAKEVAEAATPIDTGDLAANWSVSSYIGRAMTFLGVGWSGSWMNDLEYAIYVDQGTGLYGPEHRKYLIVPKDPGGALHWVDGGSGGDVYAKAVMHPGSPGHHMLAISANSLEAVWTRLASPALKNWARETERQNPWATLT